MYSRIMVPLDGSSFAEQALPLAEMLAARFPARIILFHALPLIADTVHAEALRSQAMADLERVRKGLAAAGVDVEIEIQPGPPATVILDFAESTGVDLIVMATHGRTGGLHWRYGSVADKVLHGTHVPVLLIRVSEKPTTPSSITRIMVPLDGSALAEKALDPARELAVAFNAEILLLTVWQVPIIGYEGVPVSVVSEWEEAARVAAQDYIARITRRLQTEGTRVSGQAQYGGAAECIVDTARNSKVSLIVMSTHGYSGIRRWIMGSVADRVLQSSAVPVLLIRSAQTTG